MNCRRAKNYLGPYLDSELDARTTWRVARHLESCPDCRTQFERERRVEGAIRERLAEPRGDEEQVLARLRPRALGPRRRRRLAVLAGVGVAILAAAPFLARAGGARAAWDPRAQPLVEWIAAAHTELAAGDGPVGERAREGADALEWLAGEIGLSGLHLPDDASLEVVAARVCELDGERVGHLSLSRRGAPLSVFVVPLDPTSERARHAAAPERPFALEGGASCALATHDDRLVAVVGEADAADLAALARGFD